MCSTAAVQEENLRAALVLEQAAQCLLHTSPPHVRKYAFHMVLSGLRYNSYGQQQLGMRAYRCVQEPLSPLCCSISACDAPGRPLLASAL